MRVISYSNFLIFYSYQDTDIWQFELKYFANKIIHSLGLL